MKGTELTFYLDVFPGMILTQEGYANATTNPGSKTEGYKRYAFTVTIPDERMEVDEYLPDPEVTEDLPEKDITEGASF